MSSMQKYMIAIFWEQLTVIIQPILEVTTFSIPAHTKSEIFY